MHRFLFIYHFPKSNLSSLGREALSSCFLIRLSPLVLVPIGLFGRTQSPRIYLSQDSKSSLLSFIGLKVLEFIFHKDSKSSTLSFIRLKVLCLYLSYDSKSFIFMHSRLSTSSLHFKDYQSLLSRLSKSSLHFKDYQSFFSRLSKTSLYFKDYQSLLSRLSTSSLHFKDFNVFFTFQRPQCLLSKDDNVFIYISKDFIVFCQKTTMSSFTFQKTSMSSVIYANFVRGLLFVDLLILVSWPTVLNASYSAKQKIIQCFLSRMWKIPKGRGKRVILGGFLDSGSPGPPNSLGVK